MTLTPWQRSNVLGALNYLKERARAKDPRAEPLAVGLAEVLEPSRRTMRIQREAAQSAAAGAASVPERRSGADRRRGSADRRQAQLSFEGPDRRRMQDRRTQARRGTSY